MMWWCASPWIYWPWMRPSLWTGSPEWVVDTRFAWDTYLDTDTGIKYTNPNASGNTSWEVIQTMPA